MCIATSMEARAIALDANGQPSSSANMHRGRRHNLTLYMVVGQPKFVYVFLDSVQ